MYYQIFGPSIQAEKINEEVKTTDEEESIKFMKE